MMKPTDSSTCFSLSSCAESSGGASEKILLPKKSFVGLSSKQFLWLLLRFNNICVVFRLARLCYLPLNEHCILHGSYWRNPQLLNQLLTHGDTLTYVCSQTTVPRIQNWWSSLLVRKSLHPIPVLLHIPEFKQLNSNSTVLVNTKKQNLNSFNYVILYDSMEFLFVLLKHGTRM